MELRVVGFVFRLRFGFMRAQSRRRWCIVVGANSRRRKRREISSTVAELVLNCQGCQSANATPCSALLFKSPRQQSSLHCKSVQWRECGRDFSHSGGGKVERHVAGVVGSVGVVGVGPEFQAAWAVRMIEHVDSRSEQVEVDILGAVVSYGRRWRSSEVRFRHAEAVKRPVIEAEVVELCAGIEQRA